MTLRGAVVFALLLAAFTGGFAGFLGWFFRESDPGFWLSVGSGVIEGTTVAVGAVIVLVPYGLVLKAKDFEGLCISGAIAFFVAGFSPPVLIVGLSATFVAMAVIGCLLACAIGGKMITESRGRQAH
jgi:hypothetical protein